MVLKIALVFFYEYGRVQESDSVLDSYEGIAVKDTGIGIYTNNKKFFSKVQVAFKLEYSKVSTKDNENYRTLFQAGMVF